MQQPFVIVVIVYEAQNGKEEVAATELSDLISTVVSEEPECLGIVLHRDRENPARLMLYERWTSKEAYFGPHMHTPHLTAFRERASEYFARAPEITVWEPIGEFTSSRAG